MIAVLFGVLALAQAPGAHAGTSTLLRPTSPFETQKAEWLIRHRLPCLGCHELAGEGGVLGPSLSGLRDSRHPDFIDAMIRDPQGTVPGTIMPRIPMTHATRELIVRYLGHRDPTPPRQARRQDRRPPATSAAAGDASALYGRYCAACHGIAGAGDGFNARRLPVRPTAHADSSYMSRRSDDALYDAISAGGFVMNRSNRMPPFGETLTREQIRSLVHYLRTLCRCKGPSWSTDDT